MIRINLLPFRAARKQENIRRQVSIYFLSVVCLVTLVIYLFLSLGSELNRLTAEEKQLRGEMKLYANVAKEIDRRKKIIKDIGMRTAVIETLEKSRWEMLQLLVDVAEAVPPDRLWLYDMSTKENAVELKGNAMDNDTVALFMTNLEKVEYITSVNLVKTELGAAKIKGKTPTDAEIREKEENLKEAEKTKDRQKIENAKADMKAILHKIITYPITHFFLTCNLLPMRIIALNKPEFKSKSLQRREKKIPGRRR